MKLPYRAAPDPPPPPPDPRRQRRRRVALAGLGVVLAAVAALSAARLARRERVAWRYERAAARADARAAAVTLPLAPVADAELAARPRVVVTTAAISVDHAASVDAWPEAERERFLASLGAPWRDAVPLEYPALVSVTRGDVEPRHVRSYRDGATLWPLYERLRDIADVERRFATAARRAPTWRTLDGVIDARTPSWLALAVLRSARDAGFERAALAVSTPAGLRAIDVALATRRGPNAPRHPDGDWLLVSIAPDGYVVGWDDWYALGMNGRSTYQREVAVPTRGGRLDPAQLTALLERERKASGRASYPADEPGRVALDATHAAAYQDVVDTLLAVRAVYPRVRLQLGAASVTDHVATLE